MPQRRALPEFFPPDWFRVFRLAQYSTRNCPLRSTFHRAQLFQVQALETPPSTLPTPSAGLVLPQSYSFRCPADCCRCMPRTIPSADSASCFLLLTPQTALPPFFRTRV